MLHYRSEMERAKAEAARVQDLYTQSLFDNRMLHRDNRDLVAANRRGAEMIHMKHQAGVIFTECTDRLAQLCGDMRRELEGVEAYCPEIERVLLRADFANHMLHGVNFVDLTADEETEEDSDEDEIPVMQE